MPHPVKLQMKKATGPAEIKVEPYKPTTMNQELSISESGMNMKQLLRNVKGAHSSTTITRPPTLLIKDG